MFHTEIADTWASYSLCTQMANIGAEIGRAIAWKKKNNTKMSNNALYRTLELIDLTIADTKNKTSLKEILRMREVFCDYIAGDNIYQSDERSFEKYFYYFTTAARR